MTKPRLTAINVGQLVVVSQLTLNTIGNNSPLRRSDIQRVACRGDGSMTAIRPVAGATPGPIGSAISGLCKSRPAE